MAARQLRLFAHPKPLLERLGADFFKGLPARPGVYLMWGEAGKVLYIGQSQDLRRRLSTYKNAHPDHLPRKIIRLVHLVQTITWEECLTPAAAQCRETELLGLHRPKFNAVAPAPKAYGYIGWRLAGSELTCGYAYQPPSRDHHYGAFKPRAIQGYAALLRLLWAAAHQPASPYDFPRRLLARKPAAEFTIDLASRHAPPAPTAIADALDAYLSGASPALLDLVATLLPSPERLSPFHQAMQNQDLATAADFFEFGPKRNHRLSRHYGLPLPFIPADQLDLLTTGAKAAFRTRGESFLR